MSPVRPRVTLIGRRLDAHHHALRDFLTRAAQPFEWLEEGTPAADEVMQSRGLAAADLPVLIDGTEVMAAATVERVAEAWRISARPSKTSYDLVIVGAGPAGLAAAVYAASDGLSTLLVEEDLPGGQASYTSRIENFFGFPDGIGGAELILQRGVTAGAVSAAGSFELEVQGSHEVDTPLVIAATGMVWRRLDVPGVQELLGRGVYYGAGRGEAASCEELDVVVVGGGNSAGQAAMHLATAGARVVMVVRGSHLASSMSAYLVDRIAPHPGINVRMETRVETVDAVAERLAGVSIRT